MKRIFLLMFIAMFSQTSMAQEDYTVLRLYVSNPQPRLGEDLIYSIDFRPFGDAIRNSAKDPALYWNSNPDNPLTIAYIKTKAVGKFKIPSMSFSFNNVKYKTEEFEYEVIEKLPEDTEGLWIRFVKVFPDMMAIIIEQIEKVDKNVDNNKATMDFTLNAVDFDFTWPEITFVPSPSSKSEMLNDKYLKTSRITYFGKNDPTKSIVITREQFHNLPEDYDFCPIVF